MLSTRRDFLQSLTSLIGSSVLLSENVFADLLNRGLILNPNHEIGKMMKSEIDRFMK